MENNSRTIYITFLLLFMWVNVISSQTNDLNINYIELLDSYVELGDSLVEEVDYEEAVIAYTKAIDGYCKLSEADLHRSFYFIEAVYGKKAEALAELERYEEAIICYDKEIELTPDSPNLNTIYFDKALALYRLGRYDEALVCCDTAIDKIVKRGDSTGHLDGFYFYKGQIYETKGKEFYNQARSCYEKALEIAPDNNQIKEQLERLLLEMK